MPIGLIGVFAFNRAMHPVLTLIGSLTFRNRILMENNITTSCMVNSGFGTPSEGHSILCSEEVAPWAPLSTALFADRNTRYFPSGL